MIILTKPTSSAYIKSLQVSMVYNLLFLINNPKNLKIIVLVQPIA